MFPDGLTVVPGGNLSEFLDAIDSGESVNSGANPFRAGGGVGGVSIVTISRPLFDGGVFTGCIVSLGSVVFVGVFVNTRAGRGGGGLSARLDARFSERLLRRLLLPSRLGRRLSDEGDESRSGLTSGLFLFWEGLNASFNRLAGETPRFFELPED
jgi:hypothetical protein